MLKKFGFGKPSTKEAEPVLIKTPEELKIEAEAEEVKRQEEKVKLDNEYKAE